MSTMTLEPCPFCGSDKIATVPVANIGHAISCNGCGASSEIGPSAQQAAGKWNRRAHLAQPAQEPPRYLISADGKEVMLLNSAPYWTAQPAQAVDVGAIQRVIDELRGYCDMSEDSCYGTLSTSLVREYANKLTAALPNAQEDTPDAAR